MHPEPGIIVGLATPVGVYRARVIERFVNPVN
jgi:hypothetical protein